MKTVLLTLACLFNIALMMFIICSLDQPNIADEQLRFLGICFSISFITLFTCLYILNGIVRKQIDELTREFEQED